MFPTVASLRCAAALGIVFAFLTSSIALAQATPPPAAGARTLLSQTAFARLARVPKPVAAPRHLVAPRLNLSVAVAAHREGPTLPQTQERSWASRHKVAMVFIIAGATAGGILLGTFGQCLGGSPANFCE